MELPVRKNHRLNNYDYGNYGYYFVTLCTNNKINILANIVGSDALVAPKIILTELGTEVEKCWNNIELRNTNVRIDKFIIMPNHIHGIIAIENYDSIG